MSSRRKSIKKLSKKSSAKSSKPAVFEPELPKDQFAVDENFVKLHFQEILANLTTKYVTWTPTESAWLRMKGEAATAPAIPLRKGLANMLRKSFAGCFIKYMNKSENTTFEVTEKKMEITEFMLKMKERPTVYARLNDYTEDIEKYLLATVKDSFQKNGWISQKMLLGNLPTLRLCFQKITQMDASLRRYTNLLALIITANYIKDFFGHILPPSLNMLELFGNLMFDIVKFAEGAPKLILYLGIGRNYLSNVSNLRLLERFEYLYFLDLSENDFEDLNALLQRIAKLPNLKCLSLEGNPCSVPVSYVHIVQRMCPQVEHLDGIKYVKDMPNEPDKDDYTGVLQIHGIRFFRIPKPLKEGSHSGQKVERFYQLEFEIPLLDLTLRDHEARSIRRLQMGVPESEVPPQAIPKGVVTFEATATKQRPSVQSKEGQISREITEDAATLKVERSYLRWLTRDVETPTPTTFMSPKVHWAKVLHFPSPAIEIPVTQEMWRQLRDSMRSVITMRLYYKEVTYKKRTQQSRTRGSRKSSEKSSRRGSRRSSRRSSKRQSKAGGGRQSMKRKSKAGGGRQSMKRKSKAGGGRQSMKRKSKAGGGRQSMKRQSKAGKRQSMKRGSIKRKTTGWSGKKSRSGKGTMEEVLLVRNLVAKIPVPVEIPKWNVPFLGYTWDIKERCWARMYPGLEKVVYSGSSFKSSSQNTSGDTGKSSAGKRKSRASSSGKRKSRASSAGKRKSQGGKRKSRASKAGGQRKSRASKAGGQRKSRASKAGGQRKSRASKAGGQRKSRASKAGSQRKSRASKAGSRKSIGGKKSAGGKKKHPTEGYPIPKMMTCHVGVGLKREGKEAPPERSPSGKYRKSRQSRKSKASRKSRASKAGRKSKTARKSKAGGQRKSMKRASKAGKK